MPTYVALLRYTAQGRQAMKDMPTRVQQARELARSMGGELKAFYLTMGQYDAVAVTEVPDNATAARAALIIGSAGNVITETLVAFPEEEAFSLVQALP